MNQYLQQSPQSLRPRWYHAQLDVPLVIGLMILSISGLIILYSAGHANPMKVMRQGIHLLIGCIALFLLARVPPDRYRFWSPWLFGSGVLLLSAVLMSGIIGKGAQRWLYLGLFQFQPSELMKLLVPMILAWYLHNRSLPPTPSECFLLLGLILLPAWLVAKQPDLGTALLIIASGTSVLLLAGIRARIMIGSFLLVIGSIPVVWHHLHAYQQQRVLTFIHPEQDPLGKGYHIIQSKIAIGSGGMLGKGWLQGSQSHLQFLPEESTDFIFAVFSEEFGLVGALGLISLYLWIAIRGLSTSLQGQDTFSRLFAGALSLNFFMAVFVNIAMVSSILPVVGVPLPFISYGGTSLITWAAGFGMIISIRNHRRLLES